MPASIGSSYVGVERRQPVTIRNASCKHESIRWVRALLHQAGAQYSAGAYTNARTEVVRRIVVMAPQPVPPQAP